MILVQVQMQQAVHVWLDIAGNGCPKCGRHRLACVRKDHAYKLGKHNTPIGDTAMYCTSLIAVLDYSFTVQYA